MIILSQKSTPQTLTTPNCAQPVQAEERPMMLRMNDNTNSQTCPSDNNEAFHRRCILGMATLWWTATATVSRPTASGLTRTLFDRPNIRYNVYAYADISRHVFMLGFLGVPGSSLSFSGTKWVRLGFRLSCYEWIS